MRFPPQNLSLKSLQNKAKNQMPYYLQKTKSVPMIPSEKFRRRMEVGSEEKKEDEEMKGQNSPRLKRSTTRLLQEAMGESLSEQC